MAAIPAQLAAMVGIEAGDELEFDHIGEWDVAIAKSRDLRGFIMTLAIHCPEEDQMAKREIPVTFGTGGS